MSVGNIRPEVISTFRTADGGTLTRTLVAKIDVNTEEVSIVAEGRATVSLQRDYQQLQTFADMHGPCYFLVKHPGRASWRIITYCPDSENVKTKMLYSSSKDSLLSSLGPENFNMDVHTTTKEELSFNHIEDSSKPAGDGALSKWELEHKAILRAEAQEASSRSEKSGIGGYHTVNIPLSPSAKQYLADFKSGSASFIELKISNDNESVEGVQQASGVNVNNIQPKLNSKEPRFYFVNSGMSSYLLYLCPETSPINVRMVYSTAKPGVADAAKACGINIAKIVEASSPNDVEASLFQRALISPNIRVSQDRSPQPEWLKQREKVVGGKVEDFGSQSRSSNPNLMKEAHPTAQVLAASPRASINLKDGPKKKIVVPPQGAW